MTKIRRVPRFTKVIRAGPGRRHAGRPEGPVRGNTRSNAWHGDWDCVCAEDRTANFDALFSDQRIMSAYPIDPANPSEGFGENIPWIVTEADRSVTTFLLPGEY